MPKFDVDSIGGALEYDFSAWNGPKGIVPEPPRAKVNAMMKGVSKTFKDLGVVDQNAPEEMSASEIASTMDSVEDDETFEKLNEALLEHLANICDGSPTREQLEALPYRPFMGFFGYLLGNLTNPEASNAGTNNSPKRLRSV